MCESLSLVLRGSNIENRRNAVLKDLCSGKERAPLPIQMGNINLLRPQIELKSEVGEFDLDF